MSKIAYQDEHLDLLIRLAFAQMEEEEEAALCASPDPAVAPRDALRADRAFQSALSLAAKEEKRENRQQTAQKLRRGLRLAGIAAAALLVLALAALPVTFAASAEFRNAVMKLFVQIDEKQSDLAHFAFRPEDETDVFTSDDAERPDFWMGVRFPQQIPEGFVIVSYDDIMNEAVWENSDGGRIRYTELVGALRREDLTEDYEYIPSEYAGNETAVLEEDVDGVHRVTAIQNELSWRYRVITEGLSREEALAILRSAEAYEGLRPYQAFREKHEGHPAPFRPESVPDWWRGRYFPTMWPEGMWLSGSSEDYFILDGENGARINYSELSENGGLTAHMPDAQYTPLLINGRDGVLTVSGEADSALVFLTWAGEDAWFNISTQGVPKDLVIAFAESVLPVERPAGYDPASARNVLPDAEGNAPPPADWAGDFYLSWLPQGMYVHALYNDIDRAYVLTDGAGKELRLREYILALNDPVSLQSAYQADIVYIDDSPALMVRTGGGPVIPHIRIFWEIAAGTYMDLFTTGMTAEEVLRAAQSVRRTPGRETTVSRPVR